MSLRGSLAVRVVVGVILIVSVAGSAPATASDGQDDGTPLSVTITDGSTPAPTTSSVSPPSSGGGTGGAGAPSGGTRGGGASSTSGGGAGAGGAAGGGTTTPQLTPAGEVSMAGMLYVGGLNGSTAPSLNPADGSVDLWFTVRNASTSVIDATAEFWIDGAVFSNRLDTVSAVPIAGLQPGETRVVSASLREAGQWTLISGHVTVTPPESVDGTALTPVTRDGLFLLFPWLIVVLLIVLVLAWVIVRVVQSALPPVPVAATT